MTTLCRFIDSFGFEWRAHEVTASKRGPGDRKRSLYFFSRGATRVLDEFPSDWRRLSWADLEDLCARGRALHSDGPVDLHPAMAGRHSS